MLLYNFVFINLQDLGTPNFNGSVDDRHVHDPVEVVCKYLTFVLPLSGFSVTYLYLYTVYSCCDVLSQINYLSFTAMGLDLPCQV